MGPRTADVIVGTSAGAITDVLLRRGVPGSDLAAMTVGAHALATPRWIEEAVTAPRALPEFSWRALAHVPHFPNRTIIGNWMRRPWRVDPVAALVGMVADGRVDLTTLAENEADALGAAWPANDLWICAVRQRDLRRVVFGRELRPSLTRAVMSSCAIPSFFQPVGIDGDLYLDGGVRSPTNADVLHARDLDLVVIMSPMSGRDLPRTGIGPALRRYARYKVECEVRALRAAGLPSVVIEPGPRLCETMGDEPDV